MTNTLADPINHIVTSSVLADGAFALGALFLGVMLLIVAVRRGGGSGEAQLGPMRVSVKVKPEPNARTPATTGRATKRLKKPKTASRGATKCAHCDEVRKDGACDEKTSAARPLTVACARKRMPRRSAK